MKVTTFDVPAIKFPAIAVWVNILLYQKPVNTCYNAFLMTLLAMLLVCELYVWNKVNLQEEMSTMFFDLLGIRRCKT